MSSEDLAPCPVCGLEDVPDGDMWRCDRCARSIRLATAPGRGWHVDPDAQGSAEAEAEAEAGTPERPRRATPPPHPEGPESRKRRDGP